MRGSPFGFTLERVPSPHQRTAGEYNQSHPTRRKIARESRVIRDNREAGNKHDFELALPKSFSTRSRKQLKSSRAAVFGTVVYNAPD